MECQIVPKYFKWLPEVNIKFMSVQGPRFLVFGDVVVPTDNRTDTGLQLYDGKGCIFDITDVWITANFFIL